MTATILDGKAVAKAIREEIAAEVARGRAAGRRPPGLVVVIVGEDPASISYVTAKQKAAEECGFVSRLVRLPADTPRETLLKTIDELNADPNVDGFLCQFPLPKHLDENEAILHIKPEKDMDGLHPENMGRLALGWDAIAPCTPMGCRELMIRSGIELAGKHVVIVGRSRIVGKPLLLLMTSQLFPAAEQPSSVEVCHSRTKDLKAECLKADILIAAVGKAKLITADMVKPGAVVIDVGVNRIDDPTAAKGTRLVGDVDFSAVKEIAGAITPVPGGVGPMTVAMLMKNTLNSWARCGSAAN